MGIPKIQELMQHGKYNQALEAISELDEEEKLDGLILKSRILEIKGDLEEALTVAQHALSESKTKGTN